MNFGSRNDEAIFRWCHRNEWRGITTGDVASFRKASNMCMLGTSDSLLVHNLTIVADRMCIH